MRQNWNRTRWYLAGLLTLPVLLWGLSILSQRSLAQVDPSFSDAAVPSATPAVPVPAGTFSTNEAVPVQPHTAQAPDCLPVARVAMLAGDAPDGADAEKAAELREKLQRVMETKASLLNAQALEAEIAVHERQIVELMALKDLQRLQQGLEELSDKFPESQAGKRAQELLNFLRTRDSIRLAPTPDDHFRRRAPTYDPVRSRSSDSFAPPSSEDGHRDKRSESRSSPQPEEAFETFGESIPEQRK